MVVNAWHCFRNRLLSSLCHRLLRLSNKFAYRNWTWSGEVLSSRRSGEEDAFHLALFCLDLSGLALPLDEGSVRNTYSIISHCIYW